MASLDRLGWTAGLAFRPFGLRLGIRTNDVEVLERVRRECLPADWKLSTRGRPEVDFLYSLRVGPPTRSKTSRNFHLVYASASRVARTLDLEEALAALRAQVRHDLAWSCGRNVYLRGQVVERDGQGVLLPGLVEAEWPRALAREGFRVASAGPVLLDPEGTLVPSAPPRSEARALGWKRGRPAPAIRWVVFPRTTSRIRPLAPGEAALRLFLEAPQAMGRPQDVLQALARVTEGATCLEAPADPATGASRLARRLAVGG